MGASLEPHQEAYEAAVKAECTAVSTASSLSSDDSAALEEACLEAFRAENLDAAHAALEADHAENALLENMKQAASAYYAKGNNLTIALNEAVSFSSILFWAMAFLVGTVQGGIQAVSRSYFGKLIPKERSNEFFGFFDIFGKFASVLGPFLYSTVGVWTGRSSYGVLCLIALFLIGLCIMIFGKKQLDAMQTDA
ncbi:MAG: MFS transporter [Clostridia bacterium]|nr:MFS transporter [Clostridia bacterium]